MPTIHANNPGIQMTKIPAIMDSIPINKPLTLGMIKLLLYNRSAICYMAKDAIVIEFSEKILKSYDILGCSNRE
jgi:hypothetical protein